MLLGGLTRGSPAGLVVVVGLSVSALFVVVVVISGSLVGSCNISGIVGLVVQKCSRLASSSISSSNKLSSSLKIIDVGWLQEINFPAGSMPWFMDNSVPKVTNLHRLS